MNEVILPARRFVLPGIKTQIFNFTPFLQESLTEFSKYLQFLIFELPD